ncbi:MAG: S1C family serine protease [Nitrospinaceae bacterium]
MRTRQSPLTWFRGILLAGVVLMVGTLIYENWPALDLMLFGRPGEEELDFTRTDGSGNQPVIITSDEKVNIDVFARVHSAVVNISTTVLTMNFWMQIIPQQGQGSGFIIDGKGYILTNNHVVANAQKLTVTLGNGEKTNAILIGRDPASDLAVIRIPGHLASTVADLGNSDTLQVGQKAIAIGNPFGLSQTLTTGTISALDREIREPNGNRLIGLIQTDAAINPGNSGGPLLNSNGKVIGINTAIFSLSGGYQGIGFAIPVNRAREVATQLITTGHYAPPWLGIGGIPLTRDLAQTLKLSSREGILLVEVIPGGPADQAGLTGGQQEVVIGNLRFPIGGDVILSVAGNKVPDMATLSKEIARHRVGDRVDLEILRDNRVIKISVVLGERPQQG